MLFRSPAEGVEYYLASPHLKGTESEVRFEFCINCGGQLGAYSLTQVLTVSSSLEIQQGEQQNTGRDIVVSTFCQTKLYNIQ